MKCYQCRTHFYPKRTIQTLFSEPLELRCRSCDRRYPRFIQKNVIPIDGYQLFHYALFFKDENIKEEAFMDEILKIMLEFLFKRHENDIIIFKDQLDESLFECLDQFNFGDIYLICLYPSKLMI